MTVAALSGRRVAGVDLAVGEPIVHAAAHAAAVTAHFAAEWAANPKLWNGPFFLFEDVRIEAETFRATARPTDYATFLHWRAAGYPGHARTHIFPVPAVTTVDGRLLVGVMGPATSNPGLAYPPSGSFDHHDIVGDRLDPVANMVRELAEEAGIDAAALAPEPGFTVLASGHGRLALVKRWRCPRPAAALAAAVARHIGAETDPELGGFDVVPFSRRFDPAKTVPYVDTLLTLLEATEPVG